MDFTIGRKGLLGYIKALSGSNIIKIVPSANGSASEAQAAAKRLKVVCGACTSYLEDMAWIGDKTPMTLAEIRICPDNRVKPNLGSLELSEAISRVLPFTAKDEQRPVLQCVLFRAKEGKLSLIASDGFRLATVTLDYDDGEGEVLAELPGHGEAAAVGEAAAGGDLDAGDVGHGRANLRNGATLYPIRPLPVPPLGVAAEPADLPFRVTPEKVRLGRWLFFAARLSDDGKVSCATCHEPARGFSEAEPVSTGVHGRTGTRKAPPILNAAFPVYPVWFWDGRAASLQEQAKGPMENPVEMGMSRERIVAALQAVPGRV